MFPWSSKLQHVIVIVVMALVLVGVSAGGAFAASTYDTERYTVQINVQPDNSAYINEKVETVINEPIHGIYRYVPLSQTIKFYDKNGKEIKKARKNIQITDISVEKDPFTSYTKNGNMVIQIGDENKTVTGDHIYNYSYKVALYDDGIKDYDVFYYNVLPDDSESPIKRASIKITMPKAFEAANVNVLCGKGKETYEKNYYDYEVEGNTITILTKKTLPKGAYLTVGVMLPEGYWENELSDTRTYLVLYALAVAGAAASVFLFLKRGRDPKSVKTVEFYPPEDLTSAEVGYIIDGRVDRRDIVSLVTYFANKGYLTIEAQDKDTYLLHKKRDLPTTAKSFERILFEALFSDGDDVNLEQLSTDSFYESFSLAADRVEAEYKTKDKRLFSPKASSGRLMVLGIVLAISLVAGFLVSSLFGNRLLLVATGFAMIATLVSYVMAMQAEDRRYTMRKGGKLGTTLLSLALLAAAGGITYAYIYFSVGSKIAGGLYAAFLVAGYFSFRYMQCRTRYGADLLGKVLGFREFIRVAELEKLEMLVDEDPNYFYDVLPYAYAMGQAKKWAEKFEVISQQPPSWYEGDFGNGAFNSHIFYRSFNSCMKSVTSTISPPAGGFDSGSVGGGGFSGGGGFGGGGIGSW